MDVNRITGTKNTTAKGTIKKGGKKAAANIAKAMNTPSKNTKKSK